MSELKKQVEAILFASGKKVTYEELARICNTGISSIKEVLNELKNDLEKSDSALFLTEEADGWKLTVREKFLATVQKLLPETELSKTLLETLAVIAWKHPCLQSDVIKIRTNKAYDHIKELEELGFITKEKKGRSYLLKVTNKFREYFELPGHEDIKKVFKEVEEKYEGVETGEKLNNLEVVEMPSEEKVEEEQRKIREVSEEVEKSIEEGKGEVVEEKREEPEEEAPEEAEEPAEEEETEEVEEKEENKEEAQEGTEGEEEEKAEEEPGEKDSELKETIEGLK